MTAYKGLGTYGNAVGVVTPLDHKLSNAAFIAKTTTALVIRPGVFYGGNASLISGTAGMSYSVAPYECVTQRSASAGAVFGGNDGALSVATTAAPGSNSRIDIIYHWHREYSLDGVDSNPVIGVIQGTAAAVPSAPSLAAFPGAIEIGRATVSAGATATNGGGVVITQTSPFTSADGGRVPFRTTTEMNVWTTAVQGQRAEDLSTKIHYAYYAAFDATTNPGGSKTAGWYPIPGGAEYGGKVVHGASSPTWVAANTIIGGVGVWSATAAGAAKELGIAAFGTGTPTNAGWTVGLEGVYRVSAVVHGTSAGGNGAGALTLKKNNNTAGDTGGMAAVGDINGGYLTGNMTVELELAVGDYLTLNHYNGGGTATMALGAATEELQFGIQFVRPIRHA